MAWYDGIASWLSNGDNLKALGSIAKAGGSIYGGIKQADAANSMIDLQNQQFAFNKDLITEDEKRLKESRDAYKQVFGSGIVPL